MLSEIMSKDFCAKCKFCCSFRRCSLWETPLFPPEVAHKYMDTGYDFEVNESFARMILIDKYKTEDEEEEAMCHFLNPNSGCTLDDNEKPFDCKIWPLRVMKKEEQYVITLSQSCPQAIELGVAAYKKILDNGLKDVIHEYALSNIYIIKPYIEGYPILCEL